MTTLIPMAAGANVPANRHRIDPTFNALINDSFLCVKI